MKKSMFVKCAGATMLMAMCSAANAYKVVDVSNGGSITGTIKFDGTPPANPVLTATKDADVCGKTLNADYYIVGANGGLKNAAIAIENIDAGKAYDKKAIVPFANKGCMFGPHVSTAVKGQKLGIVSKDPVLHNTHLYSGGKKLKTMYNIALPKQDKVIKKRLKKNGVVTVKCDAHEWMLGYVYVGTNPYVTVSAEDGSFTLTDVPPGNYKVTIWHEKLGKVSKDVTVAAGTAAKLDYAFK
ncbi:MAG TPA: hypothetical protein ENJ87_13180 [Gammaproteobacteria bacterium]|nr:hypothetical protein [Gammaproteobacteria bacterium]